jgi:hypothetical protein
MKSRISLSRKKLKSEQTVNILYGVIAEAIWLNTQALDFGQIEFPTILSYLQVM